MRFAPASPRVAKAVHVPWQISSAIRLAALIHALAEFSTESGSAFHTNYVLYSVSKHDAGIA